MGSVLSSWSSKVPETESEKVVEPKKTQVNKGFLSSFFPWPKKKDSLKCDICETDLPVNGSYSWCTACNKGFHQGTCSVSQNARQEKAPHSCPRCSAEMKLTHFHPERMEVKTAPKYVFPYTNEFPPPKRLRHLFKAPPPPASDEPLGPPPPRRPPTTMRRPETPPMSDA